MPLEHCEFRRRAPAPTEEGYYLMAARDGTGTIALVPVLVLLHQKYGSIFFMIGDPEMHLVASEENWYGSLHPHFISGDMPT